MTAALFPYVQEENQKPIVLIAGDTQFLGYFLHQILVHQNCQVIFFDDFLKRKIGRLDYVFCLTETNLQKIKELVKVAEKLGARFLLALHKDTDIEEEIKDFLITTKVDWRLVRLEYLYGPRMDFGAYQELLQLIKVVKIKPVFVADAVYGLVKAMFISGAAKKVFTLNNKSELDWGPRVGLEEGLKQTEKFFAKKKKEKVKILAAQEKKEQKIPSQPTKTFSWRVTIVLALFLFFSVCSYPFASLAFNSFWGVKNLKKAQQAALEADFFKVTRHTRMAQNSFSRAEKRINQLTFLFNFLGQGQTIYRAEKIFRMGGKTSLGMSYTGRAAEGMGELGKIIFKESSGETEDILAEIETNLKAAYVQFSLVQATVKSEPLIFQTGESLGFGEMMKRTVEKLPEVRGLTLQAIKGTHLVPTLIGLEKKTTFLVLLQNNMELRPTGGFIGSFALLTFNQGQLLDFEVRDVYSADGQLKGYVEPPSDLKKYLGEAGWYLRDSNWDPDFPTSAVRAAWFLEKETGRTVDGVLGINLFLVQEILEAVGEVEVTDFQEKINADNLFERAEYHSETKFFPGSTQKQDFLGSLARSLFEKIKTADQKTLFKLAKAIYQSAKEKEILVYLNEPKAMELVVDLGWDGGIRDLECQISNFKCLVDYSMVVESNVGVNKANFFVKRQLDHQVQVDSQGEVKETIKINYQNESQSEIFPAGRYKNYLRILTPIGTKLESATIGGEKLDIKNIEEFELHDKHGFGFLVEVPIKEEKAIEITYRLANRIPEGEGVQYLLLLQKQSGIRDENFSFGFTASDDFTIVSTTPKTDLADKRVSFAPEFRGDLIFEIKMVR